MAQEIKAIIFDMDGVISDTQEIHADLESVLLKEHGIEMGPQDLTRKYAGVPDRKCAEIIFKEFNKQVDLDEFVENKWQRIIEFAKDRVSAVEGALDLIEKLKTNNFKLAVASTSRPTFIELVLSELKIKDKFDFLVSGDEVKLGKPSPDIFLLTAKKLRLSPSECLVIEDAESGVIAAKRAGMKCIWLTNQKFLNNSKYSADIVAKSLKEIQVPLKI